MEQAEKEAAKTEQQEDKDTAEVCMSVEKKSVDCQCMSVDSAHVE